MAFQPIKPNDRYFKRLDENSFVFDDSSELLISTDLRSTNYQVPIGYTGEESPWHEHHENDLPVFDIALGFRSGAFFDVESPYGHGFYFNTTGSGLVNSNPAYPSEYITTSSRNYEYFAGLLNDHEDFVFDPRGKPRIGVSDKVDALAIISFRNRVLSNGLKLGSLNLKHYSSGSPDYLSSDFFKGQNFFTHSVAGEYSLIIQKGKNSYDETILDNSDDIQDRIVGRVYKNYGVILLDLVKLHVRDAAGNFERNRSFEWTQWHPTWPISAVVSSSYSWSLDKVKESIQFIKESKEDNNVTRVYFCRGYMDEFNFSTNKTFWTGSNDNTKNLIPRNDPQFTYVTSIGLYNDNNELMALGKLNKPIRKDRGSELHITSRVNY